MNVAGRPTLDPRSSLVAIIRREYLFTLCKGKTRTDIAPDRYLDIHISLPNYCVDPVDEVAYEEPCDQRRGRCIEPDTIGE